MVKADLFRPVNQTSFASLWRVLFCARTNFAVAWCEAVRPHQGYVSKHKKELPGSWQVKRPLQTGSGLTSLWGFAGVQCVPVGHPLDQAGWDQLALSGSQSAWLFKKKKNWKNPPLQTSRNSSALSPTSFGGKSKFAQQPREQRYPFLSVCAVLIFVFPNNGMAASVWDF